jgi:hypothetical protein
MAEGEGFEPPKVFKALTVFKTVAIDHSATPPVLLFPFKFPLTHLLYFKLLRSPDFNPYLPQSWQGGRDSNPQPTVLETATLPIELPPCLSGPKSMGGDEKTEAGNIPRTPSDFKLG